MMSMLSVLEPLVLFGGPLAGGMTVGVALNLGGCALARAYHRRRHGQMSPGEQCDDRREQL
jgi:hypothetical protein